MPHGQLCALRTQVVPSYVAPFVRRQAEILADAADQLFAVAVPISTRTAADRRLRSIRCFCSRLELVAQYLLGKHDLKGVMVLITIAICLGGIRLVLAQKKPLVIAHRYSPDLSALGSHTLPFPWRVLWALRLLDEYGANDHVTDRRGSPCALPEETIESYEKAARDGADYLELDVVWFPYELLNWSFST